jgi:tRNA dimethylallyltransferase
VSGEIVSCDSMQIYCGADIGTAKPTPDERSGIPHHLIDVVDPDAPFSAARYCELADRALADIHARSKHAILVGGTGLYFRALRWGLFDAPPRDDAIRARLAEEERAQPGSLHARLLAIDPETGARLAPRDLVRIIRALEVFETTGQPISSHHRAHKPTERHAMRVFVLDPGPDVLLPRIEARTRAMLDAGLVEEAKRIQAKYPSAAVLGSLGYREALSLPEADLFTAITRATRNYARRQRTWFKKEREVTFCVDGAQIG